MKKLGKVLSILISMLTIVILLNTQTIFAYFVNTEAVTNKLVIGEVKTGIIEEIDDKEIIPGEDFKKIVRVKNFGNTSCYVRVAVLISPEDYKDELALDINTDDWEYKDGYYYYKTPLTPNEETTPLFTKVHIPDELKEGDVFDIDIYSESIQSIIYKDGKVTSGNYIENFEKF